MTRKRLLAASTTLLFVVAPLVSPAQTPTPAATTPTWPGEVRAMLAGRAQAVLRGDERGFDATMAGAPKEFRDEKLTWFRRIRALPLGTYALDFTQEEFAEVTREANRREHAGEVHVIQVKERIALEGYDFAPSSEDLFLTIVKGANGWTVVADDDAEPLALQSNRNLWDFGPVDHVESDGIMVVFHPAQRSAAAQLLEISKSARAAVKSTWPNRWREDRIVVMIPSTVAELARILQTTFDLSTFVAFAASSLDRRDGWGLIGPRIYLHWPNFRRYGASFQRTIMQHEFLHLAAREISSPYGTAIVEEGIAQYYGEAAYDPPTPRLRTMVRSGRFDRHLADDFIFTAGTPTEIYSAYEQANHFFAYVGNRFGRSAGAKFYRTLYAESDISPGTWRYHLDRASRSALGLPYATLERDWTRQVVRELS